MSSNTVKKVSDFPSQAGGDVTIKLSLAGKSLTFFYSVCTSYSNLINGLCWIISETL